MGYRVLRVATAFMVFAWLVAIGVWAYCGWLVYRSLTFTCPSGWTSEALQRVPATGQAYRWCADPVTGLRYAIDGYDYGLIITAGAGIIVSIFGLLACQLVAHRARLAVEQAGGTQVQMYRY